MKEAESDVVAGDSNDSAHGNGDSTGDSSFDPYENPDYITDRCRYARLPRLMGLTLEECDLSRRMLTSVLLGGVIGYERRSSDRPAGIRTMGLVSLGSCFFTISSQLAFKSSTMSWDSSRVTAAVPSGVGFLGAGLIWKGTVGIGENEVHQVHGLTTAASLWLSAAIGVGVGGALYFVSVYSVVLVMLILRYGPKLYLQDDGEDADDFLSDSNIDENITNGLSNSKDADDENREGESGSEDMENSGDEFLQGESKRFRNRHNKSHTFKEDASDEALPKKRAMSSNLSGGSLSSFAVGYDLASKFHSTTTPRMSHGYIQIMPNSEDSDDTNGDKRKIRSHSEVNPRKGLTRSGTPEKRRKYKKKAISPVPSFHS